MLALLDALARRTDLRGSDAIRGTWPMAFPWRTFLVMPRQYDVFGEDGFRERYPRGLRYWHRLRLRTSLASVWLRWRFQRCPGCGGRFSLRSLCGRGVPLYTAGETRWHNACISREWHEAETPQ